MKREFANDTLVLGTDQKREIRNKKTQKKYEVKSASALVRKAIDNLLNQKK